jgi:hypothetical protein
MAPQINKFSFIPLLKKLLSNFVLIFTKYFKTYKIWVLDDESKFTVIYENKTSEDKDCVLFGFYDYEGATNYGNDKDIEISYHDTNNKSIIKSGQLKIGIFRIQFPKADRNYICCNSFKLDISDANGKGFQKSFAPVVSIDIYQQQQDIIDMSDQLRDTIIDGNTVMRFKLKSNSHITFRIEGIKEITVDYWDYKKYILSEFNRMNRGNVIIIQTVGRTALKIRDVIIKKFRNKIKSLLGL